MKNFSNEVKVGIIAVLTIVIFIWLYNFLKGKDFFSSSAHYYVVYDKISGLAESSPVEINGHKAGVVQSIDFINDGTGRLLVKLSVKKEFGLPVNTYAEILPASLIAGMKIRLVFGNDRDYYSDGDTIPGVLSESIISKLETELSPVKVKVEELITVLDSVITSVNEIMSPEFKSDLKSSMANLNNTTKNIDEILDVKGKDLKTTIDNLSRFSSMLAESSGSISSTFSNLESITDTLASADVYNSVMNLKNTLEKTSVMLGNLNNGKGSAGQLLTDNSLYDNLSGSLESLDLLLEDMRSNPKRYVHFSLFGRKNKPAN
jgi:phospholipid/cholesterol/gamma-HCH transport system substrate-binding protein